MEYVEPEHHQQIVETPEDIRVTTVAPNTAASVVPIFVNPQSIELQRLKPIYKHQYQHHSIPQSINQHFYKQEKIPIYTPKPTILPQTVKQHLTETTQVPPPTLTTYHPILSTTLKPTFHASYYSSSQKPLKLKPSQKYQPIIVTKPVPSVISTQHSPTPSTIPIYTKENQLPSDFQSNSLADILRKLQDSNHLPQTLTPDNIDNSIRTLIKILNNLKQSQTIVENPPQHHDDDYMEYDNPPPSLPPSEPGKNRRINKIIDIIKIFLF